MPRTLKRRSRAPPRPTLRYREAFAMVHRHPRPPTRCPGTLLAATRWEHPRRRWRGGARILDSPIDRAELAGASCPSTPPPHLSCRQVRGAPRAPVGPSKAAPLAPSNHGCAARQRAARAAEQAVDTRRPGEGHFRAGSHSKTPEPPLAAATALSAATRATSRFGASS